MRIVVTSDLHYSQSLRAAVDAFVPRLRDLAADLLIVAGDVGEGPHWFDACLGALDDVAPARAVLAGNHDVWSRRRYGGPNSRTLLEETLPAIAARHGWTWLDHETWRRNGIAVVGSMAWYDYSAADPRLGYTPEQYAVTKATVNADGRFIDWPESDPAIAARLGEAMLSRLTAAAQDPTVTEVVVVTHVPLFEPCMVRRPPDHPDAARWNFSNAYFGNLTLGRQVLAEPKVRHVISGHSHCGGHWPVPRPGPPLRTQVVASDYGEPAAVVLDL